MGSLARAARTLEEEADRLRASSESALHQTNARITNYVKRADSFVENADVNVKSALDRAEARARTRVAQTIGRTIVELEQIREKIVQER